MRKAYIRYKEDLPETTMCASALNGMRDRGIHTTPFYGFGDIESITDLSVDVGIVGYVGDIHQALKVLGLPKPKTIDYPDCLNDWMHRKTWQSTLGEMCDHYAEKVFIKPATEEKLFTGFVWPNACWKAASCSMDTEVLVSDAVDFKTEYRVFVKDCEILDCRRYKGDWALALDRTRTLEAVEAMSGWKGCPRAYCLDLGITDESNCCLVEVNDAYSFGHYGLSDCLYASMLEARWEEIVG